MRGTEHCFVVRDPYGYELDVTVDFTQATIEEVIRRSYGRITLDSSFWINCAERHLSDYLWQQEDYPPDGKITIDYLTPDDLDLARRWGTGDSMPEAATNLTFKATQGSTNGNGSKSGTKTQPIKFLTENGYSIVRRCEIDGFVRDTPQHCTFFVTDPKGVEREVTVAFAEALINEIQHRRRRRSLPPASQYWVVIAERYLGDYLWTNDAFPENGELTIENLAGDDLLLGAHWLDAEEGGVIHG
jgi:hypothetical protein